MSKMGIDTIEIKNICTINCKKRKKISIIPYLSESLPFFKYMFNICYGINIRKQWRVLQRRKEKNNVSREQYNDAVTSVSFWQLFCNFKLSWIYHISVFKIQIGPIKDFSTLENLGIISIPISISTSTASSVYINMYPPKYIWNSYRNETFEITKMYFFRDKHFINKQVCRMYTKNTT